MEKETVIIILNNILLNINPQTDIFDIMDDINKAIEEVKKHDTM